MKKKQFTSHKHRSLRQPTAVTTCSHIEARHSEVTQKVVTPTRGCDKHSESHMNASTEDERNEVVGQGVQGLSLFSAYLST